MENIFSEIYWISQSQKCYRFQNIILRVVGLIIYSNRGPIHSEPPGSNIYLFTDSVLKSQHKEKIMNKAVKKKIKLLNKDFRRFCEEIEEERLEHGNKYILDLLKQLILSNKLTREARTKIWAIVSMYY